MKIVGKITMRLAREPKKLFLVDGLGAMFTAFFLFIIMRNFNEYFGFPSKILTSLMIVAAVFCIYSVSCFLFLRERFKPYVLVISIANLLYSVFTTICLIVYYPILTTICIVYFLLEIAIICLLVYIELNVLSAIRKNKVNNNL